MTSLEIRPSPQSSGTKPGLFYGYIIVPATFILMLVGFGANNTFGIFLTPLLDEFHWTRAITSGAFSLSWIVHGFFGIVMGRLNDRFGPRLVMTICGTLISTGFFLMSQINTVWQLYLFYGVLIGIGISGFYVPLASTIARWFIRRRSMMTGIFASGLSVGILVAPPMASWVISVYDWRLSYLIIGGIVFVVIVLSAQFLKRDPSQKGQLPDGGYANLSTSVKPVAQGFDIKDAACTKQFWFVCGIYFCLGFCTYSIVVHIAPHAIELGFSSASANILATIGGSSIIGRVLMGSTADKIGNKRGLIVGFLIMAAALMFLALTEETWTLYLFAVLFGFAYGSCDAQISPFVATLFGLRSHGLIFGTIANGFTAGAALGPLLAGYIFDITDSYQIAFLACTGIAIVGLLLTAMLKPLRS